MCAFCGGLVTYLIFQFHFIYFYFHNENSVEFMNECKLKNNKNNNFILTCQNIKIDCILVKI